ncbi:MAG: ABC transporter permease [Lachnospiraceae bacterium]|nr:ABC transporter permease [Lachnospiraceae bacterium]
MRYVFKKCGTMLLTLIVVSLCLFIAFWLISGDPATHILGTGATPERLQALREELGLNAPLFVRYFRWLKGFLTGDLGTSYVYSLPVRDLLASKIPVTFFLAVFSFVLVCLIGIPLGLYTGRHAGGRADKIIMVCNQVIMSIPPFFSGILISWVFGMILHLFAPGGYVPFSKSAPAFFSYMIFPAIAIALPRAAMTAKLLRGSILEEAGKDYTRTAYSRGNTVNGVLFHHVFKNAFLPVLTFLGMSLANMLAGSLVVERVFNIPGMSNTLLTSIGNRDYPVVLAAVMWIAFVIIVINLAVDLLYRVLDPRTAQE